MSEEGKVSLKLIFANEDNSQTVSLPLKTPVGELKKQIMEQYWPEDQYFTKVETVDRLRLFAGGKELGGKEPEDAKSLEDAKLLVTPNYATAVHVTMVLRSSEPAAEKEPAKASQCFCLIL